MAPRVKRLFAEMEQEGWRGCARGSTDRCEVQRSAEMRYGEQIFEITVSLDGIDWAVADPLPQIVELFHNRHEERYHLCRTA